MLGHTKLLQLSARRFAAEEIRQTPPLIEAKPVNEPEPETQKLDKLASDEPGIV